MKGTDRWFMCDPESRPSKVVLVSPKAARVVEFTETVWVPAVLHARVG